MNEILTFLRVTARQLSMVAVCLTFMSGHAAGAAEFSIDPDGAFRIRGTIVEGDFEKWRELTRSHDAKVLRVDSGGGRVEEAMKIARDIHNRNMDIEVDGVCLSACFAYLFVAANRKVIKPKSVIGHHGSPQTAYMVLEQTKHQIRQEIERWGLGLDEAAIKKRVQHGAYEVKWQASLGRSFAHDMDVNQTLYTDGVFVLALWRRKLDGELPGDVVLFWWPSASVLEERYGISKVDDAGRPDVLDTRGWWRPPSLPPTKPPLVIVGDQYLDEAVAAAAEYRSGDDSGLP